MGRHPETSPRAHPSARENKTSLWTGRKCGARGGPREAQHYHESRASSQNSLPLGCSGQEAIPRCTPRHRFLMSQQCSGSPLRPTTLHSESSSPPVEERKAETPLSKQSGSSKKPAEATNLGLHEARVWRAHALSTPQCAHHAPTWGGQREGGVTAYPAPETPWEQTHPPFVVDGL